MKNAVPMARWLAGAALGLGVVSGCRADFTTQWADRGVAVAPPVDPTLTRYQAGARALPDGKGGVFLVWTEYETYDPFTGWSSGHIRAQHLDGSGQPAWGAAGIDVGTVGTEQDEPAITSDGAGGIIVAWSQPSGLQSDIYAQHISSAGATTWGADVAVCTVRGVQQNPVLCPDGQGGAVIAWEDLRGSVGTVTVEQVFAQRLDGTGKPLWAANGVAVTPESGVQYHPLIAPHGSGGALVGYSDYGTSSVADVKAAPISGTGTVGNVVTVCNAANDQVLNDLQPDGQGGYLLAWYDYREGAKNADVYAQRLNGSLSPQWAQNGLGIATQSFDEYEPVLAPDGQGGAVLVYLAAGNGIDLLAAKVSAAGAVAWTGQNVTNAPGDQVGPVAVSDGKGGTLIVWEDDGGASPDVAAQNISSSGAPVWTENGVPVANSAYYEQAPTLVPDGAGGAVTSWEDWRNTSQGLLYAQRFREGTAPVDTTPPDTALTGPADGAYVSGSVTVTGTASDANFQQATLEYGAGAAPATWTAIATLSASVTNGTLGTWNTAGLKPGPYTIRLTAVDTAGNTSQATRAVNVYTPGDVDGDGAVTAADAVLLLDTAAGLKPSDGLMMAAGDMAPKPSALAGGYGDGAITILDAVRVLRAARGLDTLP